jgi:hypothetical protein
MSSKEISKVWIQGKSSTTMVIPRNLALKYGLEDESHVVVEGTDKGILIRKLEI